MFVIKYLNKRKVKASSSPILETVTVAHLSLPRVSSVPTGTRSPGRSGDRRAWHAPALRVVLSGLWQGSEEDGVAVL